MARKVINRAKSSYEKYQLRGAIKEIMRNYGLRTISLANYNKWSGTETVAGIHSVKYDIMNGYIKAYGYKQGDSLRRCGDPLETISNNDYKEIYNILESLITNKHDIPSKQKRNILIKVNR